MSEEISAAALSRYLNGAIHVDALASILEGDAWDAPDPLGSAALRLIYEFGNKDWTERELRAQIRRLVEPRPTGIIIGIGGSGLRWTNDATGVVIRHPGPAESGSRTSEQIRWSPSGQYSGVGIGETKPVEAQ